MPTYLIILAVLVVLELCYFKIADHFNIIDKPNQRSSHTRIVLRGGGIIFIIGIWVWAIVYGFAYPWILAGVTLAAGMSFVDDIHSLPDLPRLIAQFAAVGLVLMDLNLMHLETWWMAAIGMLLIVSVVNFYNFMDGINGITGGYSIAVILPLLYLNQSLHFVEEGYLEISLISVLVFCFFNFRNKAKCFAGDVGSVGIAFIVLFALGKLILATNDLSYLMFVGIYAADAMMTIAHRILLKERLGEAHRKHAYQIMANELKIPHTIVSTFYAVSQIAISFGLILSESHLIYFVIVAIALGCVYLVFMKQYYHLHEEYLASLEKH